MKIGRNFVQRSHGLKTNRFVNAKYCLRTNCFKQGNYFNLILSMLNESSMWLLMQEEFAICLIISCFTKNI